MLLRTALAEPPSRPSLAESLRGLDWFEVIEVRAHIVDGRAVHFQVGLEVGFGMDAEK